MIGCEIPDLLIERLSAAQSVVVLTGAGVSAESGVPTFRSAGGLWRTFRPEDLATPQAFARDPKLVWDWYLHRRELVRSIGPNPGHHTLSQWETRVPRFTLVTQNVDGLHQRAGSQHVLELHGNIMQSRCHLCRSAAGETAPGSDGAIPCCECGGLIRPDVVWFGELLPTDVFEQAERAAASAQVFFSIGTSAVVYPAAGLVELARSQGAFVVEVNPEPTPLSGLCDVVLRGPSGQVLPAIDARLRSPSVSATTA